MWSLTGTAKWGSVEELANVDKDVLKRAAYEQEQDQIEVSTRAKRIQVCVEIYVFRAQSISYNKEFFFTFCVILVKCCK